MKLVNESRTPVPCPARLPCSAGPVSFVAAPQCVPRPTALSPTCPRSAHTSQWRRPTKRSPRHAGGERRRRLHVSARVLVVVLVGCVAHDRDSPYVRLMAHCQCSQVRTAEPGRTTVSLRASLSDDDRESRWSPPTRQRLTPTQVARLALVALLYASSVCAHPRRLAAHPSSAESSRCRPPAFKHRTAPASTCLGIRYLPATHFVCTRKPLASAGIGSSCIVVAAQSAAVAQAVRSTAASVLSLGIAHAQPSPAHPQHTT